MLRLKPVLFYFFSIGWEVLLCFKLPRGQTSPPHPPRHALPLVHLRTWDWTWRWLGGVVCRPITFLPGCSGAARHFPLLSVFWFFVGGCSIYRRSFLRGSIALNIFVRVVDCVSKCPPELYCTYADDIGFIVLFFFFLLLYLMAYLHTYLSAPPPSLSPLPTTHPSFLIMLWRSIGRRNVLRCNGCEMQRELSFIRWMQTSTPAAVVAVAVASSCWWCRSFLSYGSITSFF